MGLELIGVVDSPVLGRKGNKEMLVCLRDATNEELVFGMQVLSREYGIATLDHVEQSPSLTTPIGVKTCQ